MQLEVANTFTEDVDVVPQRKAVDVEVPSRSAPQRIAACKLNLSISAHSDSLTSVSLGIAPCNVNTFCPPRRPQAMRYLHTAACNGLSTRASSKSPLSSAMLAWTRRCRSEPGPPQ